MEEADRTLKLYMYFKQYIVLSASLISNERSGQYYEIIILTIYFVELTELRNSNSSNSVLLVEADWTLEL